MLTAKNIEQALKKLGAKEQAISSAWFFKTAKGQYGYGDVFVGVTVPEQRRVAKVYKDLPLTEIQKLLKNNIHECRLTALLVLVSQYKHGEEKAREKIAKFYLKNIKYANNWDMVDSSASYILGDYLLDKDRSILYKLAQSKNLWERRVAIVSTEAFIRKNDFEGTFTIAKMLFADGQDLIHKATGWMLREVGKRSRSALTTFLNQHLSQLSRTTLRYSIEHFPEQERQNFLKK